MIFAQIYLYHIIAKGKMFEKVYRISLQSGVGRLIRVPIFSENILKIDQFLPFFWDGHLLEYGRLLEFLRYIEFK